MPEETLQNDQDQLLEKYIQKREKNTKIAISITLVVALILAVALLTLSLIGVNGRPKFLTSSQAQSYVVSIDGSSSKTFVVDDEEYDKISKLYDEAFSTSLLTSIFTGRVGGFDKYIEETTNNFVDASITSSSYLDCNSYLQVRFTNIEEQSVLGDNGKAFNSTRGGSEFNFDQYYLALPDGNLTQDINVVIPVRAKYKADKPEQKYLLKLTLHANVYQLRTQLQELVK